MVRFSLSEFAYPLLRTQSLFDPRSFSGGACGPQACRGRLRAAGLLDVAQCYGASAVTGPRLANEGTLSLTP